MSAAEPTAESVAESAAEPVPHGVATTGEVRTVVHLLRHGEVENPRKVIYGRLPDYHLSVAGRAMAERAGEWFRDRDVTTVFASPLDRAQETAAPLATRTGLEVTTDPRLVEPWNHFEGMRFGVGDGSLRHVRHWPYLVNPFRPSWGEPYRRVVARMLAVVGRARAAAAGHEVVCVSHQLPIEVTRRALQGAHLWHRPDRRQCSLASVTSLTFAGDRLTGIAYAEPGVG